MTKVSSRKVNNFNKSTHILSQEHMSGRLVFAEHMSWSWWKDYLRKVGLNVTH